jgi:threonine dehydrogenase-like Zn-dependent dehydrogenase
MKGYVLQGKGDAAWQKVPVPEIGPYDALVRPTAVATCTTDVHAIATLAFPNALNKVIGHEAVGVVDTIGELVKDFKVGDRVVLPAILADWRNPRAQRGEAKHYQTNSPYMSPDPTVGGSFSELVKAVDADMVLAHIPDAVTDVQAVMVDDMVATGFTGVENMEILVGEVVVVLGIGPVGLMAVAAAALRGAGRIIAVGSRPKTVALARQYGATDIVDYKQGDVSEQIMSLTGGRPVDSVLVASGGSASEQISMALKLVKFGGHVACVSGFFGDDVVTIPLEVWNWGISDKWFTGALAGAGRDYYERLLTLIEYGKLDPSPLVTHVLHGWDSVDEGLDLMRSHDASVIKPVIVLS